MREKYIYVLKNMQACGIINHGKVVKEVKKDFFNGHIKHLYISYMLTSIMRFIEKR